MKTSKPLHAELDFAEIEARVLAHSGVTPEQQAQLSALKYEDIYRAMRSYGFDGKDYVQQEGMRRALVSFILKVDVKSLPPYTAAEGHKVPNYLVQGAAASHLKGPIA